jgi:hypothetical protein
MFNNSFTVNKGSLIVQVTYSIIPCLVRRDLETLHKQ